MHPGRRRKSHLHLRDRLFFQPRIYDLRGGHLVLSDQPLRGTSPPEPMFERTCIGGQPVLPQPESVAGFWNANNLRSAVETGPAAWESFTFAEPL